MIEIRIHTTAMYGISIQSLPKGWGELIFGVDERSRELYITYGYHRVK